MKEEGGRRNFNLEGGSSFILHPSSFIVHPSSFILQFDPFVSSFNTSVRRALSSSVVAFASNSLTSAS